jgi:O-glycosyl hydrolase
MRLGWGSLVLSAATVIAGCGGGSGAGTTNPPSGTAPTVTSTTPANNATGVPVGTAISATFSRAMNISTVTSAAFTLTATGGSAVAGTVSYNASTLTATFTPSASLAYNTQYTASLTASATASDGAAMSASYSWLFTTAAAPAPVVSTVTPADGSTGVSIGTTVTATFSTAMNASSITASTFTLAAQGGAAVTGAVSYDAASQTATFTPTAGLSYGTAYTATLATGVTSSSGTALAAAKTWSFTTAAAPPSTAPTLTSMFPASGATIVKVTSAVTATFNEAMVASSLTTSTFTLTAQGGGAVAGAVSYNAANMTATFTPAANLAYNTQYTATITTGATATNGEVLAANASWSFTTEKAPAPTITATMPVNGATNVAANSTVTVTFGTAMNASTLTSSTFTLTPQGGSAVAGTVAYDAASMTATFTPSANLAYGTQYTAAITTGAQTSAGGTLAANSTWSFTTTAGATVDFGTTYQTIRGFGGSTAWLGQLTTQQATALFDPANGLGLSILRVRIDPTGSAGTNNWATSNWAQEAVNAQEAQAANPNAIVFASPWTPPPVWKTSSTSQPYYSGTKPCSPGAGYCGGYLDPIHYSDYANYLEAFVNYMAAATPAVNLYAISMQNEPDWSAQPTQNYESCSWTAQQMDTWVAELTAGGATNPLTTRLMMPESLNFNPAMSNPTLADPNAVGNVAIVAGHLYGATPSYQTNAEAAGKDVWMTEHSSCADNCPAQPSIADALKAAQEVHNSMVTGQFNAYVWWWIWNSPANGVTFGLINSSTTSPAPTLFGYALGQFSKFIQPGAIRVSATANPVANVYVSAYTSHGHSVIVVINAGTTAPSLAFTLQNAGSVTTLTPYQTTSSSGLAQQTPVTVTGGQFTYTLPVQSITTLVQ